MQAGAAQGLVPRRGIRSWKSSMSCHKASGASRGMSHGGASSGRLGWMPAGQGPGCAPPSQKLSLCLCLGFWARSQLSQLLPQGCAQERHSIVTNLLQAELWLEHFPQICLCSHFQGKGQDGCSESRASRPGQVLCTLPPPPCQRKHKHPPQRKHFSSAAQVPIFAQGRSVPGSFPQHTTVPG